MSNSTARPAVFIDRDHTLIDDPGYISNPEQVRLLEGAAEAVARLRQAGYPVVVATNQSGVARGLLTEEQLAVVHQRMRDLLEARGAGMAGVDAIYSCPYLDGPEAVCEAYRRDSDLRKPKPGMLMLAAREMNLDLSASWVIGDSQRDVQAGRAAGCRTVLIDRNDEPAEADDSAQSSADHVAVDLPAAVDFILARRDAPMTEQPAEPSKPAYPHSDLAHQAGSSRPQQTGAADRADRGKAIDRRNRRAILEEILERVIVILQILIICNILRSVVP